tara:strand:- start:1551 stop:2585 length:1035 start_codon:yes stop_codon:yes gene_type:complete
MGTQDEHLQKCLALYKLVPMEMVRYILELNMRACYTARPQPIQLNKHVLGALVVERLGGLLVSMPDGLYALKGGEATRINTMWPEKMKGEFTSLNFIEFRGGFLLVDEVNNVVRFVSEDTCTVVAGGGKGFRDGDGGVAMFQMPNSIVRVGVDRFVVSDKKNNALRTLEYKAGVWDVGTLAGDSNPLLKDGQGDDARFWRPAGLCYDETQECLYVADSMNSAVRKVDLVGNVTTLVGGITDSIDGPPGVAAFCNPSGVCLEGENLLVLDVNTSRVRCVNKYSGNVETVNGNSQGRGHAKFERLSVIVGREGFACSYIFDRRGSEVELFKMQRGMREKDWTSGNV